MNRAAMLRAVNVGGRQVKMTELREALAGEWGEVKTLLASGNVVLSAQEDGAALEARLEAVFQTRFGFVSEFLVRDAAELDALIAACPFLAEAKERPSKLVVLFHREPPAAALVDLLAQHDGPERVALVERELFIDFPDGQGKSTIDRTMKKLKWPKVVTGRNWNTVLKLREALE